MTERLSILCVNPVQSHQAIQVQLWPWVKSMNMAGHQLIVRAAPVEDERSLRQLRFYWGPCLKDISEQAVISGQRYSKDAWHELFKRQFIKRKVTKATVAGRRRKVVSVKIGSTTELTVRQMSKYLEQVQAFAATDLGVRFSVQKWEEYQC